MSVTRRINNNSLNIEMVVDQLNSIFLNENLSYKHAKQAMKMLACLSTVNQPHLNNVKINDLFECYLDSKKFDTNNTVALVL